MRVLVTDGDERSALAVVRSLGRAGHDVAVVSPARRPLAGASRFAGPTRRTPDPLRDPEAFAGSVRDALVDWGGDVLIPITEASLHALLPRREELGDVLIPFPDYEAFDAVCDKARVHRAAEDLGVAVPRQVVADGPGDAERIPGRLGFPVVVKPSRSVVGVGGRASVSHVRHARDAGQLAAILEEMQPPAYPVLVQERVEGPGTGVFLLLWDGELLASFCHRRIREKPPSGGVSVLRESVPLDREMAERSRALMERFGWRGVAMVEYKRDRRSGTPYLMEVNGRFWGSLQLAVDAGVDFPRLLVEAAAGRSPRPVLDYEVGVRTRWLLGDVDHLLARLGSSRRELGLGPEAPGIAGVVRGFLAASGPFSRNEVFRWTDPRPALREAAAWVRDAAGAPSVDGGTEAGRSGPGEA